LVSRCRWGAEFVLHRAEHAQVDAGRRPGVTSEEAAEIKRLKAEHAEMRRTNEILKAASAFLASMSGSWRSAGRRGSMPLVVAGP
jgi:transposase